MKVGIIGAGHNALVAGFYLKKAGFEVEIFEKASHVGGLCVSEELFAGYKVTSVASYYGMLRTQVIEDMELEKYGFESYLTDPAEIVLLSNGDYIYTPRDGSGSKYSIKDLSDSELEGWNLFWTDIGKAAKIISPLYFKTETKTEELETLLTENGLSKVAESLFKGSLLGLAEKYFSHEKLKSATSTCTPGFASLTGTAYGCIHHGTAETCGVEGAWGLVRGGMGAITTSMKESCLNAGVKINLGQGVAQILVENDKATGLELESGERKEFDLVISTADHNITFGKLLEKAGSKKVEAMPEIFKSPPSNVSAGKVHFTCNALPEFPTLKALGHNYSGIIVSAPPLSSIIKDSKTVPEGKLPEEFMMTMAIPSVTDDTVAPEGKHLLNVDIHYLPAKLNGKDWSKADEENLLELVIKSIEKLAPGFSNCIEDSFVVSPGVLKSRYNLESMCCWQLPMTTYAFDKRNIGDLPAYHTPVENLFVGGAGTFGGGNVTGVSGYNCAKTIARVKENVYS